MFWLIFVVLKVVEVGAIVSMPWLVGHFINRDEDSNLAKWAIGVGVIIVVACVLGLLIALGSALYESNLRLARLIVGG